LTTKCHADISFTVLSVIGKGQNKMKQNKNKKQEGSKTKQTNKIQNKIQ